VKVSTRAEYGLRALMDLAVHYGEGPVQSRDIAARQGLPEPYLNQLMTTLRRAGLVSSKRGPAGGHALARAPEAISLREAFDVLEGGTAPWWCVETAEPDCIYAAGCSLRPVWQAINGAMAQVLGGITLADLSRAGGAAPTAAASRIMPVGPRP
jgi:Rrf2 family protein